MLYITERMVLTVVLATAATNSLQAAPIQLFANTSFEGGSGANWVLSGNQGTYADEIGKATDFGITADLGAGDYVLKLTGLGGWASQDGTATIAANTDYTLSYDIWLDSSNPQWSSQSRAYFYLNGEKWAGPYSQFYTTGDISDPNADYLKGGQWHSVSRTIAAADISYISPSAIGGNIGVAFSINPKGDPLNSMTYYVDNVQLNATTIPEPASLALLALSSVMLLRRRR